MAGGWPGPRRKLVATKLADDEIAALDQMALAEGLTMRGGKPNRSEMIRVLLAEAITARTARNREEKT